MAHSYKYAIAQLRAHPNRDERLNLAIVVFNSNEIRVHSARNLEKIRAISAALEPRSVEQALLNLVVLDGNSVGDGIVDAEERLRALSSLSPLGFSEWGRFFAEDASSYEQTVSRLLLQLVEPEPALAKPKATKKSKLLSSIKAALRAERILAQKGEGLESHRIVMNEQLADGLNADMLLKNGALHVVQTVDASITERARKAIQEIGVSALVFEQARIRFGEGDINPRLIYAASSQLEGSIGPALHAAQHQGAELINWESQNDRTKFVVDMSSLAEPSTGQKKVNFGQINASGQPHRRLN